jgi:predicted nuclease of predicted toxin-antitoxin system
VKFLVDECCDVALVDALRSDGYDVFSVAETMRGALDSEILARAYSEQRILLTEDKDFGELVYRQQLATYGIILLRFDPNEDEQKLDRLQAILRLHHERLEGAFVVIEAAKLRIRSLRS